MEDFESSFFSSSSSAFIRRSCFGFGAAYQIEADANKDRRGDSVWDNFAKAHDLFHPYHEDDVRHYELFEEDVKLMKNTGFSAYRFSISWPRILPTGKIESRNLEGINYYKKLIIRLRNNGIEPIATLFRWDVPCTLKEEYGGFLDRRVVDDFAVYADVCFKEFGDLVDYWITLNEPFTYAKMAHLYEVRMLPGSGTVDHEHFTTETTKEEDTAKADTITHNLLLAHSKAVEIFKKKYQDRQKKKHIWITWASMWFEPHHVSNEVSRDDGFYIRRCVELARTAVGRTSPNPMVGCVIVKDGEIVGEGFHPKAGQPHAEVFALRDAGVLARGGTAYVSLEPCNHFGRTPPCTEALIKAGLNKVVVGMVDPNPVVASKGVDKLRSEGIEVTVGVEKDLCKRLNKAYIHRMLTGKPFVTLRYSMSINGRIINRLGDKALESGGYYSKLLQEYDVVVLSDALALPASQEPTANQPFPIVLSNPTHPSLSLPSVGDEVASNVVSEKPSFVSILNYCKGKGFCSVLLDLRGDLADFGEILKEGIELNLFQQYVVEILPVWSGSEEDTSFSFPDNLKVGNASSKVYGDSIVQEGYFL